MPRRTSRRQTTPLPLPFSIDLKLSFKTQMSHPPLEQHSNWMNNGLEPLSPLRPQWSARREEIFGVNVTTGVATKARVAKICTAFTATPQTIIQYMGVVARAPGAIPIRTMVIVWVAQTIQ